MIVQCPKCKTCFEVPDDVLNGRGEIKFQCAECAYVWTEVEKQEDKNKKVVSVNVSDTISKSESVASVVDVGDKRDVSEVDLKNVAEKSGKLPSVFQKNDNVADEDEEREYNGFWEKIGFTRDNIIVWSRIFVCAIAVAIVVLIGVVSFSYFIGGDNGAKGLFSAINGKDKKEKKLYIEIAKPLTLVREGANEYLIIRGFIYNPTEVAMVVPKLVVVLENKDGLILQEQEREVEVKSLAPLEKTDFMFKVFKNSSQVSYVKVDFVDVNKI